MIGASRHTRISCKSEDVSENRPASLDNTGVCRAGSSSPSTGSYGSGSCPGCHHDFRDVRRVRVATESGRSSSGFVNAMADWSPRCSISNAFLDARLMIRSVNCAGQDSTFGQRMSLSPSLAGASCAPQLGQLRRHHETAQLVFVSLPYAPTLDLQVRESHRLPCAPQRCRR